MSKRALFVLAALIMILAAPAALLAAEGNSNACDSNGADNRPDGKGKDCPEPEPEATQSSEPATTAESTQTTTAASTTQAAPSEQGENSNKGKGGPPEDGTRGKAGGKDPGGQNPPPTGNAPTLAAAHAADDNKGYVCDDNPGIGDGNPAHNPVCVRVEAAAPVAPAPVLPRTGLNALASAALALQLIVGGFFATILAGRRPSLTIEIDW